MPEVNMLSFPAAGYGTSQTTGVTRLLLFTLQFLAKIKPLILWLCVKSVPLQYLWILQIEKEM